VILRFSVQGAPVGVNQGYRVGAGPRGAYGERQALSTEAKAYKAQIVGAARRAHALAGRPPIIQDNAIVGVRFAFPTEAQDVDSPIKFVLDSVANGSAKHPGARLVLNDNRVRWLIAEKLEASKAHPRTDVAVADADTDGCPTCGCVCGRLFP
jgi:hypothetical protein